MKTDRSIEAEKVDCIDKEFKNFVEMVFMNDKTPAYGYDKTKKDQNRFGELPGPGQRWKTPFERAVEIARKYGFETELWDKTREERRDT